jgi:SAM-dependent methyltransferase
MKRVADARRRRYARMLHGRGLEIGALGNPMPLPLATEVLYSDLLTPAQIDAMYPGARHPDIVSDSEHFPTVADGAFDFVVANHVLEHVTDPIGALTEWLRMLRIGGLLLISLPDKRYTFDHARARTTLAHLQEDHASAAPPQERNLAHLHDWAEHVEGLAPGTEAYQQWIARQRAHGFAVHNHVWVLQDILALLGALDARFVLRKWSNTSPLGNEFTLLIEKVARVTARDRARLRIALAVARAAHPIHEIVSRARRLARRLKR